MMIYIFKFRMSFKFEIMHGNVPPENPLLKKHELKATNRADEAKTSGPDNTSNRKTEAAPAIPAHTSSEKYN